MKNSKRWLAALLAAVLQLGLILGVAAGVTSGQNRYLTEGERLELVIDGLDIRDEQTLRFYLSGVSGEGTYCAVYPAGDSSSITLTEREPDAPIWFRMRGNYPDFEFYPDTRLAVDRVYMINAFDEAQQVTYDRLERSLTVKYAEAKVVAYVYQHQIYIHDVVIDGMSANEYFDYLNGFVRN